MSPASYLTAPPRVAATIVAPCDRLLDRAGCAPRRPPGRDRVRRAAWTLDVAPGKAHGAPLLGRVDAHRRRVRADPGAAGPLRRIRGATRRGSRAPDDVASAARRAAAGNPRGALHDAPAALVPPRRLTPARFAKIPRAPE